MVVAANIKRCPTTLKKEIAVQKFMLKKVRQYKSFYSLLLQAVCVGARRYKEWGPLQPILQMHA